MAKDESVGRTTGPPSPIVQALRAVAQWLDAGATPGAIVGGVAASILGRPRFTEDIDVLVLLEREAWVEFLAAGRKCGIVARIDDAIEFAETSRVLLVSHESTGIGIDVVLGTLRLEEEIVLGATKTEIAGTLVPLATPESIVVMKAIAGRARDVADIESLLEVHERLDLDWIRAWLAEFGRALGRTDFLDEFNRILARTRLPTDADDSIGRER